MGTIIAKQNRYFECLLLGSILEEWTCGEVKIGWSQHDGWIEALILIGG